ncbi:MAG: hypothetical protein R3C19_19880 [Planctomycetaceae bacterium]
MPAHSPSRPVEQGSVPGSDLEQEEARELRRPPLREPRRFQVPPPERVQVHPPVRAQGPLREPPPELPRPPVPLPMQVLLPELAQVPLPLRPRMLQLLQVRLPEPTPEQVPELPLQPQSVLTLWPVLPPEPLREPAPELPPLSPLLDWETALVAVLALVQVAPEWEAEEQPDLAESEPQPTPRPSALVLQAEWAELVASAWVRSQQPSAEPAEQPQSPPPERPRVQRQVPRPEPVSLAEPAPELLVQPVLTDLEWGLPVPQLLVPLPPQERMPSVWRSRVPVQEPKQERLRP